MAWPNLEEKSEHLVKVKALSGNKKKYSDSNWSEVVVLKTIGTSKPSGEAYTISSATLTFTRLMPISSPISERIISSR